MPDISMCPNNACPLAPTCYRNQASGTQPNGHGQSWNMFIWTDTPKGPRCPDYVQVTPKAIEVV